LRTLTGSGCNDYYNRNNQNNQIEYYGKIVCYEKIEKELEKLKNKLQMETQNFVEYEIINLISDYHDFTASHDEALAYFEEGWLIMERHITICNSTTLTQTQLVVVKIWNNNPESEKEN